MNDNICRAGGKNSNHENYGKPHVPISGIYDGVLITTCVYCGCRLKENA
jgi:hypothetical protein